MNKIINSIVIKYKMFVKLDVVVDYCGNLPFFTVLDFHEMMYQKDLDDW